MNVMVAYASKLGSTAEIADALAVALRERGMDAQLRRVDAKTELTPDADALIAGSAIYTGSWRPEMVSFLGRVAASPEGTDGRPVWLFHSGPLGDGDAQVPQALPGRVAALAEKLGAGPVKTFGGRLDERPKGLMARMVARKMAGDWRDFGDVRAWADGIADVLLGVPLESS